ncbi:MAG: insulinase family protein [Candidatus Brocadia sp.]|uniref:Peptidase n=1 Tax=Candidatus Brocadia fulgida TaxID=380242 RepID=A0A0M2UZ47_9BACT|nr:MAG: putative peptidase [Candidatus Brocadia fulgida]MCC6326100.1 insulinase family protein [Candidatus Brocadia sp.]MCE7911571.1 insulinase family protein [Candidatus Brocadia sp. AMX3]MDG5997606.1 insulinase family protein [Candidatus Brocadia sp.]RIK01147.1 MAG: insulinase family protein [Candidatus Brocadia sp.]
MNKKKYCAFPVACIVGMLFLVYSMSLCAQPKGHEHAMTPPAGKPESEGARMVSGFTFKPLNFVPPKVDRATLENGMIVYLLEDHDLPLFNISMRIRTGAVYEPPEKAGLASLTGYVMRSGGTTAMPADAMNKELEFIAASVETSIDRESGSASLSVLRKDIDKGLKIFADVIMNPAFPEDKIKMRKDEVLEAIRRENDNPSQIAHREFRRIVYESRHPYSRKVEGTPETIAKITRDDLVSFHKDYFRPQNSILGISGDFNKDEMIRKLNAVFSGWKKEDVRFPEVPRVESRFEKSVSYVYKDINQANVIMGHLGIQRRSPDYFPVMLMNFILGGGSFTARIPGRIRSDEGLAYSAHSAFQTARDLGMFFVACQTKSESTNRAISIALEELDKIRKTPVDKEELSQAKETFMNQFVFRFTTSASIVAQKVDIEYEGLPMNYLETYQENVQAVTQDDIQKVARKYLHPDQIKILVVGDREKFDKPLDSFGKVSVIELK